LIGNHCYLEGTFEGGCGDSGGGDTIINAMMAAAVEAATDRGWGVDKKCTAVESAIAVILRGRLMEDMATVVEATQ
jgi:hypothetical protein